MPAVFIPIALKYTGSVRKNDETDASRLQAVPCGARVDDTQVVFVDSKRAPIPYRKHNTPITEAYHVVKKRYQIRAGHKLIQKVNNFI